MKEPLRLAVSVFIFLTCFLLTLFAFMEWEINPGNWTTGVRIMFALSEWAALVVSIRVGIEANE